jgi:16S rRNA (uracil1498-N3)-methyltransferase
MKNLRICNKHQFAFYVPDLDSFVSPGKTIIELLDADLLHRIITVLRMQKGQEVVLFDKQIHCVAQISGNTKKSISFSISEKKKNTILAPSITVLLPILKREDFEAALYSLAELGINKIQPVITRKSQQHWSPKDAQRAHKIVLSAAEQSKNFSFPEIMPVIPIDEAIATLCDPAGAKLFCDPAGMPFAEFLATYKRPNSIIVCVGPEGDLLPEEKQLLAQQGFGFFALTPTVLRACQATALAAGILRAML